MSGISLGTYRHYKGGLYEVLETGKDHDSLKEIVVYRALQPSEFGDRAIWVRPAEEFGGTIELNGLTTPRFRYLGSRPKNRLIGKLAAVAYFDLLLIFTSAILLLGIFIVVRDFRDPGFFFAIHPILGWLVTGIFSLCVYGIGYARFIGPWKLRVNRQTIALSDFSREVRVALIADLQVGDHKKTAWLEKMVEKIQRLKPNVILIAGDLVSNELNPEDESVYLEPLRELKNVCPTFAVLGNHDYGIGLLSGGVTIRTQDKSQLVRDRMAALGIPLLENTLAKIIADGQSITIFGVDDEWGGQQDYSTLNNWDKKQPLILLAHNPDAIISWPAHLPKPALTVAGHTHGGQLRLPFFGPIGDAYLKLPKTFYRGLHFYQKAPVFVTTGVGESLGPFRLGSAPEIALLTLTKI